MEAHERHLVLDQLTSSEVRLLAHVANLTPGQWTFRESPERWSIAENIEHLVLFENFILGTITRVLAAPAKAALAEPDPADKKAQSAAKELLVLGLANSRSNRLNAREALRPSGRALAMAETIHEFRSARARTIAFAAETDACLRDSFFAHIAFGDLDCYQWLLVLGQHTLRHCRQIEEIKGDAAYPKS